MTDPAASPPTAVQLAGEYDVSRQDELRDQLLSSEDDHVIADLREVSFLDSSAIHAFVDARNRLTAAGRTLRLVNLTGMPKRVFDITGLTPIFTAVVSEAAPPAA